jgi:hypothetical protein
LTSTAKFRRSSKALGIQETFWDIIMRVGQSQVAPASQEGKRNAQGWLLRAAGPVGSLKSGGGPDGDQAQYALALFRLERAEELLRVIGCRRVADRLGGFVVRIKKLRQARWGAA